MNSLMSLRTKRCYGKRTPTDVTGTTEWRKGKFPPAETDDDDDGGIASMRSTRAGNAARRSDDKDN